MIKSLMQFPLAVDTATVKATTDILYTATDDELKAYTIGYVPFDMVEQSAFFKGVQVGTLKGKNDLNQNNYFGYDISQSFAPDRGVPFCYSYASQATYAALNAYNPGTGYENLPWGTASQSGLIHSYDTNTIVTNFPSSINETLYIRSKLKFFVVYLPDGSEGGWSSPSGENGWVKELPDQEVNINVLDLSFSVNSGTDGSYMPTSVNFTEADLENAQPNGLMIKQNGTTTYAGVVFNIFVHCAIVNAYLFESSAMNLKNGIVQLDKIRYSGIGSLETPYYSKVGSGSTLANVFTCNAIQSSISIDLPGVNGYYIQISDTEYEYFRTEYYGYTNHLISAGFTETDLKILRSIARPIYKIGSDFYVAEFTDDYEITGNLIPYAQAREWQKNINPDDNTFNYNDIPDPSQEDEGARSGGDSILPYDFVNTPLSAANNFTTLYALSTTQVSEFGAIMWAKLADEAFWHSVGVMFVNDFSINPADMMHYFTFLRYFPFDLSAYSTQYTAGIYIGRSTIPIQFPAGIEYPRRVNRNLVQIDGGSVSVTLPAPYNTHDFRVSDPATQIQLHVPFCGTVQLSAAECYGLTLSLQYVVDLQTGSIQAIVTVQSNTTYIIATLAGTCASEVQISANNNIEYLARIAKVATGGAASAISTAATSAQAAGAQGAAAGAALGALTGSITSLAGLPPVTVHKQGNASGFSKYGGAKRAYITIQTPWRSLPTTYGHTSGYMSNKSARIGDLSGYTQMINPDISGIDAHEDELEKIKAILTTGFYA